MHIIKNKNYLNNTTLWYLFSSTITNMLPPIIDI